MSHKLWSPAEGIRTNLDDFKEIIRNKYQIQLGKAKEFFVFEDLFDWFRILLGFVSMVNKEYQSILGRILDL